MALVMETILLLSLTPEQARIVGTWAIVLLVVLDVIASSDQVPFNTPRDWLLWLTQWKSARLWSKAERKTAKKDGRKWAPLVPMNYLPMTGAGIPFMVAALVGHFFHPGIGPLIGPGGFVGLGLSLAVAIALSVVTFFTNKAKGERVLFGITVAGLFFGIVVWPVSG